MFQQRRSSSGLALKITIFAVITASCFLLLRHPAAPKAADAPAPGGLTSRENVSKAISDAIIHNRFPAEVALEEDKGDQKAPQYKVKYTLDPEMQEHADSLLKRYRPDYAAIVMMDAKTGEILAMSSFEKSDLVGSNLALKATYPAASIFKVITASTAIDKAGVSPEHRIAFNGGNYTLYKKNVLSDKITKWTRFITLKDAFAKSINTAFGRLSLESFAPQDLSDYADKFFFNHQIPSDFAVETSQAKVPSERGYELTEVASGYNRFNTMSPVHGAMIASTIINNGQMPIPYIVKSIQNDKNETVYTGQPSAQNQIIKALSAEKVKTMMEQTVLAGTSRRTFKNLVHDRDFKQIEMGGKTGHFSGTFPQGRTDWFVGYASDENSKIAIAAITVNVKNWTVKSSALGEMMFRRYFKSKIEDAALTANDETAEVEKPVKKAKARKRRT